MIIGLSGVFLCSSALFGTAYMRLFPVEFLLVWPEEVQPVCQGAELRVQLFVRPLGDLLVRPKARPQVGPCVDELVVC